MSDLTVQNGGVLGLFRSVEIDMEKILKHGGKLLAHLPGPFKGGNHVTVGSILGKLYKSIHESLDAGRQPAIEKEKSLELQLKQDKSAVRDEKPTSRLNMDVATLAKAGKLNPNAKTGWADKVATQGVTIDKNKDLVKRAIAEAVKPSPDNIKDQNIVDKYINTAASPMMRAMPAY